MANGSPGLYVISGANLQAQKIRVKFKYVITLEKIEVDNPPRPLFIVVFNSQDWLTGSSHYAFDAPSNPERLYL